MGEIPPAPETLSRPKSDLETAQRLVDLARRTSFSLKPLYELAREGHLTGDDVLRALFDLERRLYREACATLGIAPEIQDAAIEEI